MKESSLSRQYVYQDTPRAHEEQHIPVGQLIKSIIYGGVDGTVNTAIILLSGTSSNTSIQHLFAITIAAIVAGAVDMACCDYISAKAEISFIKRQEERELYEVRNMLQEEKKEIIKIYKENGYCEEDCEKLAELYSTNEKAFVTIMMLEELKLAVIEDQNFPLKCGIATLLAFSLFGFITASPYIVGYIKPSIANNLQYYLLAICAIELTSLGFAKALILGISKVKASLQILIMGAIVMAIGYGIGIVFETK